ncbi:hypothetical protein K9M74_01220 [Candidatus Woesearchaeota archaeon]|nr:hypothetical protein [Candidatus Woesearchaeota archaeon]
MNRLDNFKDKSYTFTLEDRRKGGKISSKKKSLANGLKNLKHGKNSSNLHLLLRCIDCPAVGNCSKRSDGYCFFLLQEMKGNRDFSKQVASSLTYSKKDLDTLEFLNKKYSLNKKYVSYLFPTDKSSDSKG